MNGNSGNAVSMKNINNTRKRFAFLWWNSVQRKVIFERGLQFLSPLFCPKLVALSASVMSVTTKCNVSNGTTCPFVMIFSSEQLFSIMIDTLCTLNLYLCTAGRFSTTVIQICRILRSFTKFEKSVLFEYLNVI